MQHTVSTPTSYATYRQVIVRVVLSYYLLFLLWRTYAHLMPYQLHAPSLYRVHYDPAFVLMHVLHIDVSLSHIPILGALFSAGLIGFCLAGIAFPTRQWVLVSFSVLFFVYAVCFNIYLTHSAHYLGGMVVLSAVFWAVGAARFALLWQGARYYACWVYGSAFLWKVVNGAFFQWRAGELTFKANLAEYIYHNPDTMLTHMYYYFLQHPLWLNLGHKLIFIAEGAFLIGFITRKLDRWLIACALTIFLSTYLFSDVFFAELLIIIFPLLSVNDWKRLHLYIPN